MCHSHTQLPLHVVYFNIFTLGLIMLNTVGALGIHIIQPGTENYACICSIAAIQYISPVGGRVIVQNYYIQCTALYLYIRNARHRKNFSIHCCIRNKRNTQSEKATWNRFHLRHQSIYDTFLEWVCVSVCVCFGWMTCLVYCRAFF